MDQQPCLAAIGPPRRRGVCPHRQDLNLVSASQPTHSKVARSGRPTYTSPKAARKPALVCAPRRCSAFRLSVLSVFFSSTSAGLLIAGPLPLMASSSFR
jgi:hypothetical protein